jgi:hypothetical protein
MLFRRSLIAAVPVLLFLTSPIQEHVYASIAEQTSENFARFEDPMDGITIKYPPSWQQDSTDYFVDDSFREVMGFYSPSESDSDGGSLVIKVGTGNKYQNMNVSEVATRLTDSYRETLSGFKVLRSESSTLNDMPAYLILYQYHDLNSGTDKQTMSYLLPESGKLYLISYTGSVENYFKFRPTIQLMLDSLEISSPSQAPPAETPANTKPPIVAPEKPSVPSSNGSNLIPLFIIIVSLFVFAAIIGRKLKRRKKRKGPDRHDFSESDKIETMRKQDHRCAICGIFLNVVDWHHKNGDRSNNHISNCQALCPNCHADRTRRRFVK